jgi:hypothetical protein
MVDAADLKSALNIGSSPIVGKTQQELKFLLG